MESLFGSLKSDPVHLHLYETHTKVRPDLFFYIETFYKRCRRHSFLGYLSWEVCEQPNHKQPASA